MRERILQISKELGLTHIGSCLGMAQVLEEIYQIKNPEDIVILDAGHAHLAHLVAREKYEGLKDIEKLIEHDIHCNRESGCEVSTGSLGLGITIALGRAIVNPGRNVYCVLSDGGCAEGSVWEALRIKTMLRVDNLIIYVNANGWGALGAIDLDWLEKRLRVFDPTTRFIRTNSDFGDITGVAAHYERDK